ncbi:MAG: hypothetical protein KIT09_33925 [Bryobacteraceae bacterium]|nr:hypothetical protein [Bryobacteraceae bacterium]
MTSLQTSPVASAFGCAGAPLRSERRFPGSKARLTIEQRDTPAADCRNRHAPPQAPFIVLAVHWSLNRPSAGAAKS